MKLSNLLGRLVSMGVTLLAAAGFSGELAAQTLTTLYSFAGPPDGASPLAGVISDATGNLYGTTTAGGGGSAFCGVQGCGTVFKLTPNGSGGYGETVLYTFTGPDGASPYTGDLIADAAGNLYGTTSEGGAGVCALHSDCGVVFKLTPNGSGGYSETVLYRFAVASPSDGAIPFAGLIADAMGNLYGTTVQSGGGGACGVPGCGIVFKLTPNGSGAYSETVLYRFTGGTDGSNPRAGLISDATGNLYGTTAGGGGSAACGVQGCGTVFKLTPNGSGAYIETVLYSFTGGTDGSFPTAGLIADAAGDLYGTTWQGGGSAGLGTVFKLTPNGSGAYSETVLYRFTGGTDGSSPYAGLISDAAGNLYGTTQYAGAGSSACGGAGCGTVFKLTPNGSGAYIETVLYRFTGGTDGSNPLAGLIADAAGNLYGTTSQAGGSGHGTVFKIMIIACTDENDGEERDRDEHGQRDHEHKHKHKHHSHDCDDSGETKHGEDSERK